MKPLVSIVVPVFRTEQYLTECVESLIGQTYDNCEIILVDDGSDDRCPALCDNLANKYSNIVVIHQKNSGQAASRNRGLEIAKGDYIAFCDSDDRFKPQTVDKFLNAALSNQADLVLAGYETFPNGKVTLSGFCPNKVYFPHELIDSCATIHSGNELCFSWRFFLTKGLLGKNNIKFNEDIAFGEDVLFNIETVMNSDRIFVLPESVYEYRIDNQTSIMRTKYKPNLEKKIADQYAEKLRLSRKYGLDQKRSWVEDLAYYNITGFAGMLFRNALNGPKNDCDAAIKRALKMSILTNSYSRCGKRLYKDGKQNTIFRLACRYRIMPVVMYYIQKWYS